MSKYVDAEELKKVIRANDWSNPAVPDAVSVIINYMPAADVSPVRHGHWIDRHNKPIVRTYGVLEGRCSRCGLYGGKWSTSEPYKYCPYCGAKMDEV